VVLGPTVVAGNWCVAAPGGASCTHPTMSIDGGDGNDRITLGPGILASVTGMGGDDILATARSAVLEGGPGNDQLSAGAASSLSGGAGDDVAHAVIARVDEDVVLRRTGEPVGGEASHRARSCERGSSSPSAT
jgi:Ca2+-binding RTX toxin-like protein